MRPASAETHQCQRQDHQGHYDEQQAKNRAEHAGLIGGMKHRGNDEQREDVQDRPSPPATLS